MTDKAVPQKAVEMAEVAKAEIAANVENSKSLSAKGAAKAKKNGKEKLAPKTSTRKTVNDDGTPKIRAPKGYLIVDHAWKNGKDEVAGFGLIYGGYADPVIAKATNKKALLDVALLRISAAKAKTEKKTAKAAPKNVKGAKNGKAVMAAEVPAAPPAPTMPAGEPTGAEAITAA